jgi:Asp-tRNA(Asn)/Glu-tRNA(Gln) amidotransferase A subunit family amidase
LNAVVWERFKKARQEARSDHLPKGPFTGVPFLTKDLGRTTAGKPVGVQLGAAYAGEDGLIRLAARLEKARPPVHA